MRMQLEVEFLDGTKKDVLVVMSDMVKFESEFSLSIAKLGQEMKVTHLLWLAWSSLTRQKQVTTDFDSWVETVAAIGATDPKVSKG
jgi:hypothetical protein